MRVAGCPTDHITDSTFDGMYLPELSSIGIYGGNDCDITDAAILVVVAGCVNLYSIELADCIDLTWQSLAAIVQRALTSFVSIDVLGWRTTA